jgi:undecaprenyl-diphosphatase
MLVFKESYFEIWEKRGEDMQKNRKRLLVVNLFALILFLVMWYGVVHQQASFLEADHWINSRMDILRNEAWIPLVKMLTDVNGLIGATLFSLGVTAFFLWKRWFKETAFFLLATVGASILFALVKSVVERGRPVSSVLDVSGYSFPSGHTTMATAMAFALYMVLQEKTTLLYVKIWLFAVALGWSLVIAWTRLYLDVHWFTDVIGGFGLGLFWVTFLKRFCK